MRPSWVIVSPSEDGMTTARETAHTTARRTAAAPTVVIFMGAISSRSFLEHDDRPGAIKKP